MSIDWLNLLLILALAAGHIALVVAVSNRIHAWPLTRRALRCVHRVHDLLLVVLPAMFVALAGFKGPRLLFGGAWQHLPLPVLAYLVVCGVIAAAVPVVGLARRLRPLPAVQLLNHSETIDV